jgi:hypothetical protein
MNPANGCLSDYAIDRLVADETRAGNAEHAGGCETCTARIAARRAERDEFHRTAPRLARPRRRAWVMAPAIGAVAAAAVMLFLLRPPPTSTRTKGAGLAAAYVRHDGAVRRAVHGEAVAAGDSVQITTTLAETRQVAVVGVDGAGAVTVYRAPAPQPAGSDVPLDFSIVLDAVRGDERLVVRLCDVVADLGADARGLVLGTSSPPPGCSAERFVLVKP